MNEIKKHLITELTKSISQNTCMVEQLLKICNSYYEQPVYNLHDMKMRNKKVKGDMFEYFCQLYLKHCYGLKEVWLLNDVPVEIRKLLNLKKRDFGIDLIGIDENNKYYAIQSKFRKRTKTKKISVTWKQLSTFFALCERTGPYEKYIVFTTADYVRRIGKKSIKDETINFNKLKKISHFDWMKMCEITDNHRFDNLENKLTKLTTEELRNKRLLFYSK